MDFAVPADHQVKLKQSEKRDKYQDLVNELKTMEHESDYHTNVIGTLGKVTKGLVQGLEDLEIKGRG